MIPRLWFLLVVVALGASGCDTGSHARPTAGADTSAQAAAGVTEAGGPELDAFVAEVAHELALELGLDPSAEERLRQTIARGWVDLEAEVQRRVEGGEGLDPDALTVLLAEHQRRLDLEIAAGLDSEARSRLAALTGEAGRE